MGISHDTAQFAAEADYRWWKPSYPRDRKVDQTISMRPLSDSSCKETMLAMSRYGPGLAMAHGWRSSAHVSASGHGNAQVSTRPPRTLGKMREQGVHHLIAPCKEDSWGHRP